MTQDSPQIYIVGSTVCIPYRMKIITYMELSLVSWRGMVKFAELYISEFWFVNINFMSYYFRDFKNLMKN